MKTIKLLGLIMCCCMFVFNMQSQDDSRYQRYLIHMDPVKPPMQADYEKTAAEFVKMCKDNNYAHDWMTLSTEDSQYFYISPMKNFAEMDENPMASLREKVGAEKFGKVFEDFDKCYDTHTDFVLSLDKELSYMPDGMTTMIEGENYRENTRYYFAPSNMDKALEAAKAFKKFYSDNNLGMHYRLYRSGFGADGTYFLVAVAAKDAMDMERKSAEARKAMGPKAEELFGNLNKVLLKTETMRGWMRPDLSYISAK
jgi:hypothetical protein